MQFLCQHTPHSNHIYLAIKSLILHRDWCKLAAKVHSGAQMRKNDLHYFGAQTHQNGFILFSHQFGAQLDAKGLKTREHRWIGQSHHFWRTFDTQLDVTTVHGMVHTGQAEHFHAHIVAL